MFALVFASYFMIGLILAVSLLVEPARKWGLMSVGLFWPYWLYKKFNNTK